MGISPFIIHINLGWFLKFSLQYNIKPFTDEVLCDVSPLEVCDVLLGQPYLWKRHVVYESRPRSMIITIMNPAHKR